MFPNATTPRNPQERVSIQNWLGHARDGLDLLVEFATLGEYAGPSHRRSPVQERTAEPAADRAAGSQHTDCPTPKRELRWARVPRRVGAVVASEQICVYQGDP